MQHLGPLIWLTDVAELADPDSLGLQSAILDCDRTKYRLAVQAPSAVPWSDFLAMHRALVNPDAVAMLEYERDVVHWWVSPFPIRAFQLVQALPERWALP